MMRLWALLIIAANLIGLSALVFIYPQFMVAPGPLIPAHVSFQTNCFACHSPLRGAVAERCMDCHIVADIGLLTTTGAPILQKASAKPFHQSLIPQNCMACHTDHSNVVFTPRKMTSFSHAMLNPTTRENCTSCHTAPATTVHAGMNGQCSQCHSQAGWKPATFDHTRFFVLDRNHITNCITCHATTDKKQYTCFGCHEHTQSNIRAIHIQKGITNFTNCVSCHRSAHGEGEKDGEKKHGGEGDD